MNNLEQYLAAVPAETAFVYFFSHGCEICPAREFCHAQTEGTCCHGNFMAWAEQKTPLENIKTLIKALRDKFAPRIRELCADDKFNCDKLCAGNILTAQCIVFQAADALEEQAAEIAEYLSIGTVEEFRSLKDAEQKRQPGCVRCESPCQTCMIGCFKQEPDTCGGYTLPPMQYFCKTCGRDLRGESHE